MLAIHEQKSRMYVAKNVIKYNQESCILSSIKDNIIMLHEDNVKGDRTKHISLNFFYICVFKKAVKSISRK